MGKVAERIKAEIDYLDTVVDGLGKPIDEGIIFLVALLRCHGFNTTGSCEGHLDRLLPPWIDIVSPDEPKLLKKMQDGPHGGPEFMKNHRAVVQSNRREAARLFALLEDFYEAKPLQYRQLLVIEDGGAGRGRLTVNGGYFVGFSDKGMYKKWLTKAHKEIEDFITYLEEKLRKVSKL